MPEINVIIEGDGCWPDILQLEAQGKMLFAMAEDAKPIQMALLKGGMTSGQASVSIRIDLPDGSSVLTETSVIALIFAANVVAVHCPKEAEKGAKLFLEALERGGRAENPWP